MNCSNARFCTVNVTYVGNINSCNVCCTFLFCLMIWLCFIMFRRTCMLVVTAHFILLFNDIKTTSRDVRNFFISFWFRFEFLKKLGSSLEWVWFSSVKNAIWFGYCSYLLPSSCNSKYYSDSGWHDVDVTDVTHNNNDNM